VGGLGEELMPGWHLFFMEDQKHLPFFRHLCAVIYHAIATKTGPLFEPGDDHDTIGHHPDAPEASS
jgi:urease beta subunit